MNRFSYFFSQLRENLKTRYGLDVWSVSCLVGAFVCATLYRYTDDRLLQLLAIAFVIAALVLVFRKKPELFKSLGNALKGLFERLFHRLRDASRQREARKQDTEHRYYRCPQCSRMLRVPKGKGKVEISCTCGRTFTRNT